MDAVQLTEELGRERRRQGEEWDVQFRRRVAPIRLEHQVLAIRRPESLYVPPRLHDATIIHTGLTDTREEHSPTRVMVTSSFVNTG